MGFYKTTLAYSLQYIIINTGGIGSRSWREEGKWEKELQKEILKIDINFVPKQPLIQFLGNGLILETV